jgi:hypothetical protein
MMETQPMLFPDYPLLSTGIPQNVTAPLKFTRTPPEFRSDHEGSGGCPREGAIPCKRVESLSF